MTGAATGLAAIAASILKADPASAQALFPVRSFIELGGTSILAMRLAARAADELSVQVPIEALLSSRPLAAALASAAALAADPGQASGAGQATAASPGQRGMWTAEQLAGQPVYTLIVMAFLDGPLDEGQLEQAIRLTVARHEGLRTVFRLTDDGGLERYASTGWEPRLTRVTGPADGDFRAYAHATATRHGREPFALDDSPPLRFLLLTGGNDRAALVLVTHHMLLDAWGIRLALQEIFTRYGRLTGPAGDSVAEAVSGPAPRLEALLTRQQALRESGEMARQAGFWAGHLHGVPAVLDLPADRPRPWRQDPRGERLPFRMTPQSTAAIRRRAAALGVTPFSLLLTAYGLLISRYTGQRRLLVGVPVAGRPTTELEGLVGQCAAVVPVVIDIDEAALAGSCIRGVQRSLASSMAHADLPLDEMVGLSGARGEVSRNPLVHLVCGMYDGVVEWAMQAGQLAVRVEEGHAGTAPMDLTLAVQRSEPGFGGILEYSTGVWTRAEATGFLGDLLALTEELAGAEAPVQDLRGLSASRRAVLTALNNTSRPYPGSTVEQMFLAQARRTPDATAVRDGSTELSYRTLEHASAGQALALHAAGVRPGDTVAVAVDRSAAETVAVLAALRAGAAYLGLDDSLPRSRLSHILAKAGVSAAVAGPAMAADLQAAGLQVVPAWQPGAGSGPDPDPAGALPAPAVDPDRIAYVAFTSGSTGEPKGVRVTHRGVIRTITGADYARLGPGSRFLRFGPLRCDPSTLEIWGPLLTGGAVEVYPHGVPSPQELGRFIAGRGVTGMLLMTGVFRLLAEFAPDCLAGVSELVTGGEVMPTGHVTAVLTRNPGLTVVNGYGPTENTLFTTVHEIHGPEEAEDPVPIGVPIPNTRVYILDDRHRLLPPGAVGELYAAGDGLAAGYAGDPAETDRQFGHFSPDVDERLYRTGDLVRLDSRGRLRFLGRRDDQVKISGFRVEPEEVRRTVCEHPAVDDALVIADESAGLERHLVVAYVARDPSADLTRRLAEFVAARLPHYMVPARWVSVPRIPLTATGKADREALVKAAGPPW